MTTTEATISGDDRNFTINFGPQHPAALRLAGHMTSIFKAFTRAVIIIGSLAAPLAMAQAPDMSAYMPSKAEMRKGMVEAGMAPDQIENILNGMSFPGAAPASAGKPTSAPAICVDANANDVCDEEEGNPEITECRKIYLDRMTKVARDNYGGDLGSNATQVGQTCSMAATGGTMRDDGEGWYIDFEELRPIADYWVSVMNYSRYIYPIPSHVAGIDVENLDVDNASLEQLQALIMTVSPDMRTLMANNEGGPHRIHARALPVHNKCENIRRRVGQGYRSSVLDKTVCLKHVPDTEEPSEEGPSDE